MTASALRAGRLDCVCDPASFGDAAAPDRRSVALLGFGFALSVLAQVLTLSVLPLAGLALAPSPAMATLPFAAFYAGAALASLPASFLLDAFGRRAAFALGASLGIAGGGILAWAILLGHFGALALGGFWLGIASGFSLFYRHAAAPLGGSRASAVGIVFGAGALAGLAAPSVMVVAEQFLEPRLFVGAALAAALSHVGSLAATASLTYRPLRSAADPLASPMRWQAALPPTLLGASSWFVMTALMGAMPLAMAGCGLDTAVAGTIAWHVTAMYAPSLIGPLLPRGLSPTVLSAAGAALLLAGLAVFMSSDDVATFSSAAVLAGSGWSVVTLGTTLQMHRSGQPSRWQLAMHDGALLTSALLGALAAGILG
jgi:MFS family permease